MNLPGYLSFLGKIASVIPFSLFDYIVFAGLLLYVLEDALTGTIAAGIGFFSTVVAFFMGLAFYHPLSQVIEQRLSLTKGISDAIAYLLVTAIAFTLVSALLAFVRRKYVSITIPKNLDMAGGAIFGLLSFFFIASFAVAFLLSFPVSTVIKNSIKNSASGKFFVARAQTFEGTVRQVFGGAIEDTINFLTIEPSSNESVGLNFKTNSAKVDEESEQGMLKLLNQERRKAGLSGLTEDSQLTDVARAHARDMLEQGYFSHYTPEGLSPFDRMEQASIVYQYAGENLAFAPEVTIAMDGLMKSPGHRANILSPNFGKVGIGVLDAGIYGKMFVQEFTD